MTAMNEADTIERAARVAALISVSCRHCEASPGESCEAWPLDLPIWRLDRDGTYAHLSRMVRAVRLGQISYEDCAVQFGDVVPEELARLAVPGQEKRWGPW